MIQDQINQLHDAIEAIKARKIDNVYFVACGGSMAAFYPSHYIFDVESTVPSFVYTSNEFVHRAPKSVGPNSLVVTCSHSGNTPETVRATEVAREKGALTVSFSNKVDSPLWNATDHGIYYVWGDDCNQSNGKAAMIIRFAFSVLNALQPSEKYERAIACCELLNDLFIKNKAAFADQAKAFGSAYKRSNVMYTMSSGPCYGEAYSLAICFLMEMQWVNASSIHSGEYFHGPFEITDDDIPFFVIKNYGATRPLDERALAFCEKYTKQITVLDCRDLDLTGIDEDLRDYFAVLVAGAVIRTYVTQLADFRGHPMTVRRYMWRMEY